MDKKLEIKDYLDIALRRKWFFIIPFMAISMIVMGYARWAPKSYQASTLILVEQPQLSTNYVQPTVTERMEDRLRTIEQQITSRSFQEVIVEEFDLLKKAEKTSSLESVIQSLRKRITIQVTGSQAFSISFKDRDPVMAMKIANRLTTLFIERNLQQREGLARGTVTFLDKELQRVQKLLLEQERKVSEFRTRHLGELPEQLDANLRTLDRLQNQLQNTTQANVLESDDVVVLNALLKRLRLKYTDEHPEIIRLKARIAELESGKSNMGGTATADAASITQLRAEENRLLQDSIKEYQRRVEMTPKVDQQLRELTRGYEVTQREYQSLLDKRLQAEMAASMESMQKGERFLILDEAKIPVRPFKPDRQKVLLIGLLIAMASGVGLVAVIEYLDTSFYNIEDLERFAELPVIASISKVREKKTFYKVLEQFTVSPAITTISKMTKNIYHRLEGITEEIFSSIPKISKIIKKGGGTNT
jgi:uncharacterized protein involved in exopolysaccharide biosynthesis